MYFPDWLGILTSMNMEKMPDLGKSPKNIAEQKEPLWEKIQMPHLKPISDILEKYFKENNEPYNPEITRDVLYSFIENGLEHTKIQTSEKYKASFPWTTINTGEIAKSLYKKYSGGKDIPQKIAGEEKAPADKEFVFPSFQVVQHGNPFTFTEESLHQIMSSLPRAMEDLKQGKEPHEKEITIVGSPTNLLGTMSQEFLEDIKKDAFGTYGGLYSELIESELKNTEEGGKTNILLYGISMGGSLATETAKRLIEKGLMTQSNEAHEKEGKPFMQVRIDTPPGPKNAESSASSLMKKARLYGGFALEVGLALADAPFNRAIVFGDKKYVSQVNAVLAEKGIRENMTPEQEKMKKEGIRTVVNTLAEGVPMPEQIRIREVIGLEDTLMDSSKLKKAVEEKRKKQETLYEKEGGTLGKHSVTDNEYVTSYGADMRHWIPFPVRENEIKRMAQAVRSLRDLKS